MIDMRERQELVGRDTFTIAGDLHIPSSVNLCLNREGTPGVQILKTFLTHPHWTHSPAEPGPKVPVLNMRCEPIIKNGGEKKMDISTKRVKLKGEDEVISVVNSHLSRGGPTLVFVNSRKT